MRLPKLNLDMSCASGSSEEEPGGGGEWRGAANGFSTLGPGLATWRKWGDTSRSTWAVDENE